MQTLETGWPKDICISPLVCQSIVVFYVAAKPLCTNDSDQLWQNGTKMMQRLHNLHRILGIAMEQM